MSTIIHSPGFLRHRKFILVLPVLIVPFIIILFILLGGGKGRLEPGSSLHGSGLNVKLPDAHFKKGADKSKLSLYEEASKDSAILKERIKNDPYYLLEPHDSSTAAIPDRFEIDQNETRIMNKLAQIKAVIHKKDEDPVTDLSTINPNQKSEQIQQLEKMISNISGTKTHNPDMDQLNSMLNKIMAIQHPEILQDSLNRLADDHKTTAYPVNLDKSLREAQTFGDEGKKPLGTNRFYDLAYETEIEHVTDNAVEAVIPETQVLVSGSTVKLRLTNDIRINGHLIPRDQLIYGTTSLSNERLKIQFSSIRSGNNILPVSLEAYDMDGLAGVFIPGSINRDVAKQSGDQAMNAIGLTTLDPSLGAQAASAGIQAAKTLVSRKVKLIRVTVKAGYRVLLKNSK
jgi:conjugative transposon TraM protein